MNGDRRNPHVMSVYMELSEGDNKLLAAVKAAIPFDITKVLTVAYVEDGYEG